MAQRGKPEFGTLSTTGAGLLSAALLVLAFPFWGMSALAWVALVPLVMAARSSPPGRAFGVGLLAGFLFHWGIIWWGVAAGSPLGAFNLALVLCGAFTAVFALSTSLIERHSPGWGGLAVPAAWVALEYAQVNAGSLGVPWGVLGNSQYSSPWVIAIASLGGVYAVSFLVVAVNVFLVDLVMWMRVARRPIASGATLASGLILLGVAHVPVSEPAAERTLRVVLVQGGVYDSTAERSREDVFIRYRDLTLAASDGADLIVWPESAVPTSVPLDTNATFALLGLAQHTGSHLLAATSGRQKGSKDGVREPRANSAFLMSPKRRLLGRYDKVRLMPFNEYVPYRGRIPWPSWIISEEGVDAVPGEGRALFALDELRFGVLICWENFFAGDFRDTVRGGGDFMVSLTNEDFTPSRAARYLSLSMNTLRAAENRVWVLRAATTGVTAIISPSGEIVSWLRDESGEDLGVEGVLVADLPLGSPGTLYTRFGDWLPLGLGVVWVLTLMACGVAALRPREAA